MQTIELTNDSRAEISKTLTTASIQIVERHSSGEYRPSHFVTIPKSKINDLIEALNAK